MESRFDYCAHKTQLEAFTLLRVHQHSGTLEMGTKMSYLACQIYLKSISSVGVKIKSTSCQFYLACEAHSIALDRVAFARLSKETQNLLPFIT